MALASNSCAVDTGLPQPPRDIINDQRGNHYPDFPERPPISVRLKFSLSIEYLSTVSKCSATALKRGYATQLRLFDSRCRHERRRCREDDSRK